MIMIIVIRVVKFVIPSIMYIFVFTLASLLSSLTLLFQVAPMVVQSEVTFRMLTRKYKAELCYTPMIQAKKFGHKKFKFLFLFLISYLYVCKYYCLFKATDPSFRKMNWDAVPEDRPLFAQFCANDPNEVILNKPNIYK